MLSLYDIAGTITNCQPLLIKRLTGSYDVLIGVGGTFQCFSSKTGELISTFCKKHTSNITCIGLYESKDPISSKIITSCSADGQIEVWPYIENQSLELPESIISINVNAYVHDIIPISSS